CLYCDRRFPYLHSFPTRRSSDLFWGTFSLLKNAQQLQVFLKRVLFMTGAAGLIFVVAPLKYAIPRPEIENAVFRGLFWILEGVEDRKSTRLNSSHVKISYAVFCL